MNELADENEHWKKGKKGLFDPPRSGGDPFSVPSVLKLNIPTLDEESDNEENALKELEFEKMFLEGEKSYSCGEYKKAIECFEESLKLDPKSRLAQKKLIEAISMDIIETKKKRTLDKENT